MEIGGVNVKCRNCKQYEALTGDGYCEFCAEAIDNLE